jgi:transposase
VKGRKRHIAVDTEGLLTELAVHEAHIQDRDGAIPLLKKLAARITTIRKVWFDAGYAGRCVQWVTKTLGWDAEVVRRPDDRSHGRWRQTWLPLPGVYKEFPVLPRRWVVERTFAWLGRCRRLSKDYEALIETSESVVWIASLRLLLARLADA